MPKKTISPLSFFKNEETPKGQFKQAANYNNGNINSISKSLGSHFSSQQSQIKALSSNISNIEEEAQQTAKKVDATNSLLQQSISVQNNILKTLNTLVNKVEKIESSDSGKEKDGGDSLASRLLKGLGLGAAGIAAITGAAVIGNNNIGANSEGNTNIPSGAGAVAPKEIYDYLKQKGADHTQAMGIMGNITRESSLKPSAFKANDVNGPSGGLFQHHDNLKRGETRFTDMTKAAGANGQNWKENWKGQIDFAFSEGDMKNYLSQKYSNSNEAAAAFYKKFERGANFQSDQTASESFIAKYEKQGLGISGDRIPNQQDTGTSTTPGSNSQQSNQSGEKQNNQKETAVNSDAGQVIQEQGKEAAIRKLPISPELLSVLEKAAREAGVIVRVKSGGQPTESEGGQRTGSTRHDRGMAADLDIYSGDKKLSPKNSEDLPIFKKFVSAASAAGATGIGAGEDYMSKDGSRIHVGFGSQAIWGAGGSGQNAAGWLREAVGGTPGGEMPGPRNTESASEEQPQRNYGRQMNPMRNQLASIGGMVAGRQGAAIGGLAGMLLPAIQNILGNIQGDNRAGVMQPGTNYEQAKAKSTAIDKAAVSKETQTQTKETPKQQQTDQQNQQQSNEVTQTATDTKDKPEWFGDFRAGLKHAYLDFDGKMIYI